MALSQGAAGGLPGMELRAWGRVSSTGVLVKGSGISSVVRESASGAYQIELGASVGPSVVVTVAYMGAAVAATISASGVNVNLVPIGVAGAVVQTDFYFEVYV